MNEKTKDILIRAGKTFWQAALAYLLADAAVLQEALTDWSTVLLLPAKAIFETFPAAKLSVTRSPAVSMSMEIFFSPRVTVGSELKSSEKL